jgi:hypothetical protein
MTGTGGEKYSSTPDCTRLRRGDCLAHCALVFFLLSMTSPICSPTCKRELATWQLVVNIVMGEYICFYLS